MKIKLFSYNTSDTFVHRLSGVTKLVSFIALTSTVMLTFDIRIIAFVFVFSLILFRVADIKFSQVRLMLYYVWVFIAVNFVLTFLFAPTLGCDIYGTRHELFTITSRYVVTTEQLFYQITKAIKYLAIVPVGMVLLLTTNPSELAASMNAIGIPYKICSTIALTLRYFPDVAKDYSTIALAQQARGIELSSKARLRDRFRHVVSILTPLIFTTVDRIDVVSNAMELRGFGKKKKRSWYAYRPLERSDYLSLAFTISILIITIMIRVFINHGVYYNPFI